VTYTQRFEQCVLESLVGTSVEDVSRQLGVSAEMVEDILEHQLVSSQPLAAAWVSDWEREGRW